MIKALLSKERRAAGGVEMRLAMKGLELSEKYYAFLYIENV